MLIIVWGPQDHIWYWGIHSKLTVFKANTLYTTALAFHHFPKEQTYVYSNRRQGKEGMHAAIHQDYGKVSTDITYCVGFMDAISLIRQGRISY